MLLRRRRGPAEIELSKAQARTLANLQARCPDAEIVLHRTGWGVAVELLVPTPSGPRTGALGLVEADGTFVADHQIPRAA